MSSRPEPTLIDVDGQRLRVAIQTGDNARRPLLLLNGLGANLELFQPFVDALGEQVASVRIDLPGVGGSPAAAVPASDVRPGTPGRPSTGSPRLCPGGRARHFMEWCPRAAVRAPASRALPPPGAGQHTGTGAIMVPARPSVLWMLASPRRYDDSHYLAAVAPHLYGGRLRTQPELAQRYARAAWSGGARGYYAQLFASAGWTSIHWLWRLRQPTLIMSGRDDPIVPWINGWIMAQLIRDARLHLFDDGHLGLMPSARELAPVVRSFLV